MISVIYKAPEKFANIIMNQRGMGRNIPPNRKIVVEKWCYFPEVYQMTKVLEDGMENVNFPLRFSYVNLKILSK